jgi:hypothetical protein
MTERIDVKLTELSQLFNSLDPAPFHERDLDHDAEEFIVSWAQEHPHKHDLKLVVHLAKAPAGVADAQKLVSDSIAHYFDYRSEMTLREFKRLMREGRKSLLIGLLFLALCQFAARLLPPAAEWRLVAGEGITIMGWVAMWKPLEIYLYRWWPLLALRKLYHRLRVMPVEVHCSASA